MTDITSIRVSSWDRWIDPRSIPAADESVTERCSHELLQEALEGLDADLRAEIGSMKVTSAQVNRTGRFEVPPPRFMALPPGVTMDVPPITDLPPFCDVRVGIRTPGGQEQEAMIWVPLGWNSRFLGCTAGGDFTLTLGDQAQRHVQPPFALRNGFATATIDGTRVDTSAQEVIRADGTIDAELIANLAHRSLHAMTIIAKAIVGALHGRAPRFSYLVGDSVNGRQAMASAQFHPGDYDGIWSEDPAINWTRVIPAGLWPATVMHELDNVLPEEKLEAFRSAVLEACDGADGVEDGFLGAFEPIDLDPHKVVGTATPAGEITQLDAEVMELIWAGPRRVTGERLWFGPRPGTRSWGSHVAMGFPVGLCVTTDVDSQLVPAPFGLSPLMQRWVTRDPEANGIGLTFAEYESLFDQGCAEFAEIATDNPDLTAFRDAGGKLLLSHAGDDEVIPFQGSVNYYRRVIKAIGGLEETRAFARLFVTDGDMHNFCYGLGPGLTLARGMAALMTWVENGQAPETIIAESWSPQDRTLTATRPAYAYPGSTSYNGDGDPADARNYHQVPASEHVLRNFDL
ncbi:MAG: tannase/feruloyl esterase family alpha/beta hydrolase [Nocardioides sp.]|uniref:tannase/feruloyl esterase family alpha/beta hydrolase n=1 Tax=Nocardioides sp. TaxID=35761 RepID=UPI0039E67895